ncbi:DUF1684 domain-containing protein [Zhouia sp. PK063]|uniref:DUF1684 domain-containing protein n=1 Tax=Zhouia sp. PK063 TaxID=3373602 RepID=UPI00379EC1FA
MKYILFISTLMVLLSCKSDRKYHNEEVTVANTQQIKDTTATLKSILKFQEDLNNEYRSADESPLTDKDKAIFESLEFFPIDTNYVVKAKFVRTPNEQAFMMPTTTDRKSEEVIYGVAYFTLHGQKLQLNIYQNQQLKLQKEYVDYLFLPFSDKTNGDESYGGGRYIDLRIPEGDTITIDFNKAYNPYCAYNKKYSCPLVPKENDLPIEIPVGVKKFHD